MDNKKKMEELEASFKQNNILITQYQAEIQKLTAIQEQIKGKFELLKEMETPVPKDDTEVKEAKKKQYSCKIRENNCFN